MAAAVTQTEQEKDSIRRRRVPISGLRWLAGVGVPRQVWF